jgi:hypothetical protein
MRRKYYYQPGVFDQIVGEGPWAVWSDDLVTTRRREAEAAAKQMARRRGGVPVIGYWDRDLGESPRPDAVRVDIVRGD